MTMRTMKFFLETPDGGMERITEAEATLMEGYRVAHVVYGASGGAPDDSGDPWLKLRYGPMRDPHVR